MWAKCQITAHRKVHCTSRQLLHTWTPQARIQTIDCFVGGRGYCKCHLPCRLLNTHTGLVDLADLLRDAEQYAHIHKHNTNKTMFTQNPRRDGQFRALDCGWVNELIASLRLARSRGSSMIQLDQIHWIGSVVKFDLFADMFAFNSINGQLMQ